MNSVIVGQFNTSVSTMDRSSRQRINNKTADLNNTIDQIDLTNINRTFYLTTWCTHFSQAYTEHFPG